MSTTCNPPVLTVINLINNKYINLAFRQGQIFNSRKAQDPLQLLPVAAKLII